MYTYISTNTHANVCKRICMYAYMYMCVCTCVYILIYIYIYVHIYIGIRVCLQIDEYSLPAIEAWSRVNPCGAGLATSLSLSTYLSIAIDAHACTCMQLRPAERLREALVTGV